MTTDRIAFITGATGGIGQAAAAHFHDSGYRLWLCGRDETILGELAARYPTARISKSDLADPHSLEALCAEVAASSERISVGLVNAGIVKPGHAVDLERAEICRHLDINLRAATHLSQALAQHMKQHGDGHIIGTQSAASFVALPGSAAYTASKFGIRGYYLSLAEELRAHGIAVTSIYPNAIDTPMLRYEAANGGSALNFLSTPSTTDDVVAALKRAQKGKKLEYFVPRSDVVTARLLTAFPGLMRLLYPTLNRMGEKGRQKFLKQIE
ncbi:SDR family oxidoreductase [Ruegeria sp. 2012CJ41-6]|uniref:SDR family oxidoreductase n=1 Tax=Ruegeria spongiae TaxID=2942209 RepID=A0ABT0PZ70_9RHOB|nr:SDR family oxidoreductase [Ruegeria spongiae]MCL6281974.1 SDR family oxidoreductase [Ruegeria spongiae]